MPAHRKLLNVRSVLEGITEVKQGLDKYGYCPAIEDYVRQLDFLARAILRKRDATGTRKDLYVESSQ